MRLPLNLIVIATFALAAVLSVVAAFFSVRLIEINSQRSVQSALFAQSLDWSEVYAEGLNVFITGTAPSEAERFKAISLAGGEVDAARVIDNITVASTEGLAPPRFSIEILRNDGGISLIGLIPEDTDRRALGDELARIARTGTVTDLLETGAYDMPDGWTDAFAFSLRALRLLPRSKISAEAGRVAITALADSEDQKRELEAELMQRLPASLVLDLDISAPRPVITPFTLRFVLDEQGARFDACSADSATAQDRILAAAQAAGASGNVECTIGLGVPSTNWASAVEVAIGGLAELGAGSVTFADADISLQAPQGTSRTAFDRVVGEMEAALPDAFALRADLPEAQVETEAEQPEFVATLSPEGTVQMRGRVRSELTRSAAESFAQARFGIDGVYMGARLDANLPESWPLRVLAAVDALSRLSNGVAMVTPESVTVRGNTGNKDARAEIARLLVDKIGEGAQLEINVTYQEKLDPVASLPSPETCQAELQRVQAERKIQFEPGKASIDASAAAIMDDIADILKQCGPLRLEIQGHTDSQGREEMNLQLSQGRAEAILTELRARRVLTGTFTAKGYGETQPIADNESPDGREANRRIEFVLVRSGQSDGETTLESQELPLPEDGDEAAEDTSNDVEGETDDQN